MTRGEPKGGRHEEIRRGDPAYPRRLDALTDAPERLFVLGELPCPWGAAVGIVGSREADPPARRHAAEIAAALSAAGAIVVSGGARGIDTAAHEGAIEGGGRTVAVLGSGLGRLYPPANRPLFERIAGGFGAVATELPASTPPSRWSFPRRNRLIAALSDLVVVVQAPSSSGALITARIAGSLGVPVAAIPGTAGDPRNRGNNGLLRAGARLVESAADVLDLMNRAPLFFQLDLPEPPPRCKETPATAPADLGDDEILVLDRLGREPVHIDEIVAATGLGAARTQAALLTLELAGFAEDRGGKLFTRPG
ncbi:MAG: DNA-processing protein DprA [Proteobacteria bacterium]|jgi:DNA processing protein|nr:DNA-processing protein DprA [Pseudomonadota bacterium]